VASQNNKLPYGNISSTEDVGRLVRAHRKAQTATQAEFASLCGVGVRFISDLENGKPTMELGKVLHVLQCLGLELTIQPRGWQKSAQATLKGDSELSGKATTR
jgi:HTH-type transcriptional regulator/antitoxin HipB